MKFNNPYERVKTPPERNNGERLVEIAGYIPAVKRIENIINAGQRLVTARTEQYDFPDGKDDGSIDPTRRLDFDMAEASTLYNVAADRIEQAYKTASEAKLKASKAKKEISNTKVLDDKKNTSETLNSSNKDE